MLCSGFKVWNNVLKVHTTIMKGGIDQVFYYGYCKDQRNAAVIILRYTTLRHNGL